MKVLIVHNAYQSRFIGGEDIVVRREIEGLKTVLGEQQVHEYIVHNDDIRPFKLIQTLWGDKTHYQNIYDYVKTHQIDIVHVHNFFPLLTPTVFKGAKKAGAFVVHTLHNFRWWCLAGTLYRKGTSNCQLCLKKSFAWPGIIHGCYRGSWIQSGIAALAFWWYRVKAFERSIDAYFALSHFQMQKLKGLIPESKLWLKPDPITMPLLSVSASGKKDYLYVGRLEAAKGIETLLKAWQTLPSEFRLLIIGTGEDAQHLSKKYEHSNISFLGQLPQEDVFEAMSKAKYLIHPSLAYETFGLTMLEALARGTPVIGFNRGTRPEFIHSGKNGFLCEPASLRDAILQSEQVSNYSQLSQAAIVSAKPFYLKEIIAQQVKLYEHALKVRTL